MRLRRMAALQVDAMREGGYSSEGEEALCPSDGSPSPKGGQAGHRSVTPGRQLTCSARRR